jgi:hypothetical protein
MNCPMATSKKKIGTPAHTRLMKYGTRKAPEKRKEEVGYSYVDVFASVDQC